MRIRARMVLIRWVVFAGTLCASVAAALALRHWTPGTLAVVAIAAVFLGAIWPRLWPIVARAMIRRAYARCERALGARAFDEARDIADQVREAYAGSRAGTESVRLLDATILSREARHAEAVALLESLDRAQLGPTFTVWVLNNLAWSLAHVGQGERAVELASESIAAAERAPDVPVSSVDMRGCQLGTLGAALVAAGRADEAVAKLEQAHARGGPPHHQAARSFYLGEALYALGRLDPSEAAWQRAVEECRESEHGQRATRRLKDRAAYR